MRRAQPAVNFPPITAEAKQRADAINAAFLLREKEKADAKEAVKAARAAERAAAAAAAGKPLPAPRQPISKLTRPTTRTGAIPTARPLTAGASRKPPATSKIGRTVSAAAVNTRTGTRGAPAGPQTQAPPRTVPPQPQAQPTPQMDFMSYLNKFIKLLTQQIAADKPIIERLQVDFYTGELFHLSQICLTALKKTTEIRDKLVKLTRALRSKNSYEVVQDFMDTVIGDMSNVKEEVLFHLSEMSYKAHLENIITEYKKSDEQSKAVMENTADEAMRDLMTRIITRMEFVMTSVSRVREEVEKVFKEESKKYVSVAPQLGAGAALSRDEVLRGIFRHNDNLRRDVTWSSIPKPPPLHQPEETVVEAVVQNPDGSQEPVNVSIQGPVPPPGTSMPAEVERESGLLEDVSIILQGPASPAPSPPRAPPRSPGGPSVPINQRLAAIRRVMDDLWHENAVAAPPSGRSPLDDVLGENRDILSPEEMDEMFGEYVELMYGPEERVHRMQQVQDLLSESYEDPNQLVDILPEALSPAKLGSRRPRTARDVDDLLNISAMDERSDEDDRRFSQMIPPKGSGNLISLDTAVNELARSNEGLVLLADILENRSPNEIPQALEEIIDYDFDQFDRERAHNSRVERSTLGNDSWANFLDGANSDLSQFLR